MKKDILKKKQRKTVGIVGLGLLGSSLGLALKKSDYRRAGWSRRPESRKDALHNKVVDEIFDRPEDLLAVADITVVCLPIPEIVSFCLKHTGDWRRKAIVTDVGSVKGLIVKKLVQAMDRHGVQFVGSHPMAGSEKSGAAGARGSLYQGATVFITPEEGNTEEALRTVRRMWEKTGAKTVSVDPRQHDQIVAFTSHLSHVVSSALTSTVLDTDKCFRRLREHGCAGGFRDTTRTASSNPQMWKEIIEGNKVAVIKALKCFSDKIGEISSLLESEDFERLEKCLATSRDLRDEWLEKCKKENRQPAQNEKL